MKRAYTIVCGSRQANGCIPARCAYMREHVSLRKHQFITMVLRMLSSLVDKRELYTRRTAKCADRIRSL